MRYLSLSTMSPEVNTGAAVDMNTSSGSDGYGQSSEWSIFLPDGNLPYDLLGGPKYMAAFPAVFWSYIGIACTMILVGFSGNLMILASFLINKHLQRAQNAFIFNLCLADLLVTGFADPFSVVGLIKGALYFDERPGFCSVLSVICTMACIAVLLSIGGVSFNRYINICHNKVYHKLFSLKKNIAMCVSFWLVGLLIASCTLNGWSNNRYDPKFLECHWNRVKSLSFTIFFTVGVVFTPVFIISFSYVRIYLHVRASRARIADTNNDKSTQKKLDQSLKLAKTLFLIFSFFVFCWTPYALTVSIDFKDRAPLEDSYKQIIRWMTCGKINIPLSGEKTTNSEDSTKRTGSTVVTVH